MKSQLVHKISNYIKVNIPLCIMSLSLVPELALP